MKRFGSVTLVLAGFIAGLVFVYSCSLGGNGVEAQPQSPLDIRSYQVELTSSSSSQDVETLGSESFVMTDITVASSTSGLTVEVRAKPSAGSIKTRFFLISGGFNSSQFTQSIQFASGIPFNPGDTISVSSANIGTGTIANVNISGYLATN